MRTLAQQTNATWTKTTLFSSLQEFSTGVGIYWPDATRMCQPQGISFCLAWVPSHASPRKSRDPSRRATVSGPPRGRWVPPARPAISPCQAYPHPPRGRWVGPAPERTPIPPPGRWVPQTPILVQLGTLPRQKAGVQECWSNKVKIWLNF